MYAFLLRSLPIVLAPILAVSAQSTPPDSAPAPRRSISVLPVLGSAPETGGQFGVALFVTMPPRDAATTRPSTIVGNAVRTAKSQTRIFLDTDRWSAGNRWRVVTNAIWQEFPLAYFGMGDESAEDAEEAYTPRGTELAATVHRLVAPDVWVQVGARRIEQAILRTASGGELASGTLTGSAGGRTVLAMTGVVRDSRDNLFAATSGHFAELTVSAADAAIGSEFDFSRVRLDVRGYRALRGEHVVAAQVVVQGTGGDAPFDQRALIGSNSVMRGYVPGRFRDRWSAAAQGEYRSPSVRRFSGAVFAGAAVVGPNVGDLASGRLLPTYGAGLRFRMNPVTRTTVRVDYARGTKGQGGLYVAFSEAF
jgi:outer membrane protein assembly factor BamA